MTNYQQKNRPNRLLPYVITAFAFVLTTPVHSSELSHQFINPSFGGNPGNSAHLLGLAGTQNQFEEEQDELTPLQEFNDRLQRSLLGRITSAVTSDIVDNDGNITPGVFETIDYTINVIDEGGGLVTIETIDKVSGDRTVIQVRNDVSL